MPTACAKQLVEQDWLGLLACKHIQGTTDFPCFSFVGVQIIQYLLFYIHVVCQIPVPWNVNPIKNRGQGILDGEPTFSGHACDCVCKCNWIKHQSRIHHRKNMCKEQTYKQLSHHIISQHKQWHTINLQDMLLAHASWIPQELDLLNAYTLIWIHKNCEIYYLAATELWHHILWLHIITCMFLWLHHVHISTVTPNLLNEHKKCFVTYKLYTQSISNNAVSPISMQCRPQSNRLDPTKLVWLGLEGVFFRVSTVSVP